MTVRTPEEILQALDFDPTIPCDSPTHDTPVPAVWMLYRVHCCPTVDQHPVWFACQPCLEWLLQTPESWMHTCGSIFMPRRHAFHGWGKIQ